MSARERSRLLEGWVLVLWAALGIAVMVGAVFAASGAFDLDTVKRGLRATARTSLALFLLAFAASSLRRLWPNRATGWLLRNRRYVGVSFAVSHFTHLGLIASLAHFTPERFANPLGLVPGFTAYLFLAAMTATSFDRTTRWLGKTWWRRLHLAGSWWIWVVFAGNYASKVTRGPGFAIAAAACFAVAGLRVIAWLRARAKRRS
jgi:methionine sulfoxide reductase heme-binding subunit